MSSEYELYEMNPAGLAMIEADDFKQIQGKSFVDIITPQYKKEFEKLTKDIFRGESRKLEFEIIGLKGTHRWMQIHAVPMKNADGKIISLLGITRDISENKKIETDLIQAKELAEGSVKAKELFQANMSHEIRTPMNAIIGMSEILQENNLSLDQKECVNVIKLSADNLLSIINNILDFSKLEVGQVLFENLPFKLEEILKGIVQTLHFTNEKESTTLSYTISDTIPLTIIGDSVRLRQILLNLVSNSIKFTEIGNINIDIQLESQQNDIYFLIFKVTDTGIGIPSDKQSSIFESFVQVSSETTRKYGGTGLGLAITKQLVELQGGTISVSSIPNQGSCFFFTLGFRKAETESIPLKTENNNISYSKAKGLKILLVEDNLVNQLLARKILIKWNCTVDIADNGKIAIDKLSNANYDVILMDIQMPEMDGCEATKYIRKNMSLPASVTPIIAITANALVGEEEKYIAIGMNDYISKPFSQKILYEKIIRWTGRDKIAPF
jgi:signal transduction histidine kinase/ActR/RegA family two-component response regulator